MSDELKRLYEELHKTEPESPESNKIAEQILETVFDVDDHKAGSTVHEVGCPCGFCEAGFTKA